MKRLLSFLLLLILTLTACGEGTVSCPAGEGEAGAAENSEDTNICTSETGPNRIWPVNDDITISLPQDVYPLGTDSFTVTFENTGSDTMLYGENYMFQYYDGSGWTDPETIENYAFNAIGYLLAPNSTQTLEVRPWMLREPLQEGLYRIVGCSLRVGAEDQLSYGGSYTEYEPYMLEFRISADGEGATAEAQVENDSPFRLEIQQPDIGADCLAFSIHNESGADVEILLIPTLEYINEFGNWEVLLFLEGVGFCGTPDPLPQGSKDWSVELNTLWGELPDGQYRLGYTVTDSSGIEHTVWGEFTFEDGLCSLPPVGSGT